MGQQCTWEQEISENDVYDDCVWVVTTVGCVNDVRLNNAWLPMDRSQNDENEAAVFGVRSQNVHDGCESNACVGILCEPGLVCVDVWRQADCRLIVMNVHMGLNTRTQLHTAASRHFHVCNGCPVAVKG